MSDKRQMIFTLKKAKTDEWYTPSWAVVPLLKYIPRNTKVWCPFDKFDSAFVQVLGSSGIHVVYSHIDNREDFFKMKVPDCDYIVSNPPYSRRDDVLHRLFDIGKPFAMLLSSLGIGEGKRWKMFSANGVQFLIPNRRVNYFNGENQNLGVAFQSWYVCHNFLPRDIIFEEFSK